MTIVVPFDGSELSRYALEKACKIGDLVDAKIVVVTAIPNGNSDYARDHRWIGTEMDFDGDTIQSNLRNEVSDICRNAEFKVITTRRRPSNGTIANKIRSAAKAEDASMVVIGSNNAGRITPVLSSVGDGIATDTAYDVLIVRS